jgi:phage protein D
LYPYLTEVTVEVSRENAATIKLIFESRRDELGNWVVQDSGILENWKMVKVNAVFGTTVEEVMRGYIKNVKSEYPEDSSGAKVTVECQDESIKLDRDHQRENWGGDVPTDDFTIMQTILGRHNLTLHPESQTGQTGLIANQDGTDIQFIKKRAEANGYELLFAEGMVYFGPMRLSGTPQDTIMVYAGTTTNCVGFSVDAKGDQPDRVQYDLAAEEGDEPVVQIVEPDLPLLGTTAANSDEAGVGDYTWRMTRPGGADEEQIQRLAQHKANTLSMKVQATGDLDGSLYGHVLRVAQLVAVDGVGDWLGGLYYVDKVEHKFSPDGYSQSFTLLRNAYGDNYNSGATHALAGLF